MIIRKLQKNDLGAVEETLALYWTDPEFLKEVVGEIKLYIQEPAKKNRGFYISEENGEVIGIVGFRKIPNYLRSYATTKNPVESYVLAVRHKRRGIGEKLKRKQIEEVQKLGFSEILLYSPNSHKESWPFHDKLDFERVGEITPPDDEVGQVWRKVL